MIPIWLTGSGAVLELQLLISFCVFIKRRFSSDYLNNDTNNTSSLSVRLVCLNCVVNCFNIACLLAGMYHFFLSALNVECILIVKLISFS